MGETTEQLVELNNGDLMTYDDYTYLNDEIDRQSRKSLRSLAATMGSFALITGGAIEATHNTAVGFSIFGAGMATFVVGGLKMYWHDATARAYESLL